VSETMLRAASSIAGASIAAVWALWWGRNWLRDAAAPDEEIVPGVAAPVPQPLRAWIVLAAAAIGAMVGVIDLHVQPGVQSACWAAAVTWLALCCWTDATSYVLPDGLTVPVAFAGLASVAAGPAAATALGGAIQAAAISAGALVLVAWIAGMVMQQDAMGFGDMTLSAALGVWLGPWGGLLLWPASVVGLGVFGAGAIHRRLRGTTEKARVRHLPFGVALAVTAVACHVLGVPAVVNAATAMVNGAR